jgi:DNA invertase Pin-like site-specific DNA recombinase
MLEQALKRRRRQRRQPNESTAVILYVRVSTDEQAQSRAGLDSQRSDLMAECERRGWTGRVMIIEDAGYSAKDLNRPGMQRALAMLASGEAGTLAVSKLDRLSRSLLDFAGLMARSESEGWSLVALDLGVDTGTAQGEMLASVLAAFAQFERRLISQRTKDGLAAKRAQGVRLGRPLEMDRTLRARLADMRGQGMTYRAIAATLTAEGVPTARGSREWYPSTVRSALEAVA